jgi:hypothetical protein
MHRSFVAVAASFLAVAGSLKGQAAPSTWSAGVAWQGPSPGDRSIGAHIARRVSESRLGSLRVEGAVFTIVGKRTARVCAYESVSNCEVHNVDGIAEILATLSLGERGKSLHSKPIVLLGGGAYVARHAAESGTTRSFLSGLIGEAGVGLRLPPSKAQLTTELTIRRYFGLESDWDRSSVNFRVTHSW